LVKNDPVPFGKDRGSMRIRWFLTACLALLIVGAIGWAQSPISPDVFFSVPPADAPELAPRGAYQVGVRTLEIKHPGQIDILNFDKATGKAPLYDRPLTIEVWYPAVIPAGQQERTIYDMGLPVAPESTVAKTVPILGKALRDASPVKGQSFPLVIVSHGYPGSRFFLSYLTENLASKGYVVVAIDHTDSVFGALRPFPSTLLNRASDHLYTMATIEEMSHHPGDFLNGLVDSARTAIVGYSMGGYGALAGGGAGYSKNGLPASVVPGGYLDDWMAGSAKYQAQLRKEVKAIVAISPWGAQPPFNAWDADGLAGLRVPLLVIAGDQDDVADFPNGIKPAFDKIVHADRCLLVYENARHNIGGNPPTPELSSTFTSQEFFNDPVWRKDRITGINQHFVTAFLDLNLKGDETKRAYLHPASEKSNDGKWPLPPGESANGKFGDGTAYWKGFQRRWAVGLEMHCSPAEQ
jgi:predicted dienelactone hydrolase